MSNILDRLHDSIMESAVIWATTPTMEEWHNGIVTGEIYAWGRVALQELPGDEHDEIRAEYLSILGRG